jgi:tRNA dimethylallyltransferase
MNPVIVITGATGCGKSGIINQLSKDLPIEVINADSRQIYKYLKIGTATPSEKELDRFPHHLFSFLDPRNSWSAGEYASHCKTLINQINNRGKIPIIVGGTFFYIKALWDGLIESITENPEIVEKVNQMNLKEAYDQLQKLDPQRASRISHGDSYRIRKSLISCLILGEPVSSLQKKGGIFDQFRFESFWIDMDRNILYERINKRVEKMFSMGLLAEVTSLIQMGYGKSDPGLKTIGYREILGISEQSGISPGNWNDDLTLQAVSTISMETRHFAKRQLTWFRHEPRLKRIDHVFAVSLISDLIIKKEIKK